MSQISSLKTFGGGKAGPSAYEVYVEVQTAAGQPILTKEQWALREGGLYDDTAIRSRLTTLEENALPDGTAGQLVGFDGNGNPVAVTLPPVPETPTWSTLAGKPTTFPPVGHQHPISDVQGLQAALDTKAENAAIMTSEQIQDLIAAMFQAGAQTGVSVVYDDASGTLNLTVSGGSGGTSLSQEEVEDFVGGLVQTQGTGISIVYDDAANVLRIGLSGESFTTALKAKLDALPETFKTVGGQSVVGSGDIPFPVGYDDTELRDLIANLTGRVVALESGSANLPPASFSIPAQTARTGVAYSADFTEHFSDPDADTLAFVHTGTLPPGIARTGAAFAGTPTTGGVYNITLTATDPGGLSTSRTITWTVGQAPAVVTTASISANGTVLDGPLDTVTGYPTPTATYAWYDGANTTPVATTKAFDHGGVYGAYRRQTSWTNGVGSPAVATSNTITIGALPSMQVDQVTPNPIVASEAYSIQITPTPDNVQGGSLTHAGDGLYNGMAPASGVVGLIFKKAGHQDLSVNLPVDTAVITPNAAITTAQMYDGQTVGDIPNFASINSTSYFTRTGRTIASVQAKKGQMVSPGPDQPAVLSNLVNVTGATVLAENDTVVIDVTDSGGTMRRFTLADVQYAVKITAQGQEYILQVNDLIPGAEPITVPLLGQTVVTSRNELLAGPVNIVPPAITGTAELGAVLTKTDDGKWLGLSAPTYAHQWERDGAAISGATGASHTVVTADEGKAVTLDVSGANAQGARTATSNAISIPAAGGGGGGEVPDLTFASFHNLAGSMDTAPTTGTKTGVAIGAADANRYVWVACGLAQASPWNNIWASIKINGVAASLVGEAKNYANHVALFRLLVPAGTTADIEWTTTFETNGAGFAVFTSIGASPAVVAPSEFASLGPAATATLNGAIPGSKVFAIGVAGGHDGEAPVWTGATQIAQTTWGGYPFKVAIAETTASGAGSATVSFDTNGDNSRLYVLLFAEGA